jgi:hypothetical protein
VVDSLDEPVPRVDVATVEPVADALHRRARLALAINLAVALCCFGLLSIPGAVAAGMALRAIPADPHRADRLIRWSWAFLGTNLVFYVLLLAVVLAVAVFVFLAGRSSA